MKTNISEKTCEQLFIKLSCEEIETLDGFTEPNIGSPVVIKYISERFKKKYLGEIICPKQEMYLYNKTKKELKRSMNRRSQFPTSNKTHIETTVEKGRGLLLLDICSNNHHFGYNCELEIKVLYDNKYWFLFTIPSTTTDYTFSTANTKLTLPFVNYK